MGLHRHTRRAVATEDIGPDGARCAGDGDIAGAHAADRRHGRTRDRRNRIQQLPGAAVGGQADRFVIVARFGIGDDEGVDRHAATCRGSDGDVGDRDGAGAGLRGIEHRAARYADEGCVTHRRACPRRGGHVIIGRVGAGDAGIEAQHRAIRQGEGEVLPGRAARDGIIVGGHVKPAIGLPACRGRALAGRLRAILRLRGRAPQDSTCHQQQRQPAAQVEQARNHTWRIGKHGKQTVSKPLSAAPAHTQRPRPRMPRLPASNFILIAANAPLSVLRIGPKSPSRKPSML